MGCTPAPGIAGEPDTVCVRETLAARDIGEFVAEAVEVLSACGHAPEAFTAGLHFDDPFALADAEREPEVKVVFEPLDERRHYALGVSASDPCVVSWIWRPHRFTDWQRRVLERARTQAHATDTEWIRQSDRIEVRVTESLHHVGLRVWSGAAAGSPELRVVLAKDDLSVIETEQIED